MPSKHYFKKRYFKFRQNSLSKKSIKDLFSSTLIAYEKKLPLNRFVTINLEHLINKGHLDKNVKDLMQQFLKHYRYYAKKHDFEAAYVWVLENKEHMHIHILLHYPPNKGINAFYRSYKKKFKCFPKVEMSHKTINYGYCDNNFELREKAKNHMAKILREGKRVDYYKTQYQFDGILSILSYLSKGIESDSQGQIMGHRFYRSRNLQ